MAVQLPDPEGVQRGRVGHPHEAPHGDQRHGQQRRHRLAGGVAERRVGRHDEQFDTQDRQRRATGRPGGLRRQHGERQQHGEQTHHQDRQHPPTGHRRRRPDGGSVQHPGSLHPGALPGGARGAGRGGEPEEERALAGDGRPVALHHPGVDVADVRQHPDQQGRGDPEGDRGAEQGGPAHHASSTTSSEYAASARRSSDTPAGTRPRNSPMEPWYLTRPWSRTTTLR